MSVRFAGPISDLEIPLGLRLSLADYRKKRRAQDPVEVVRFAFDHGIRVIVTDLDDDLHFTQDVISQALERWRGPRDEIKFVTRSGPSRYRGRLSARNGHHDYLRKIVDASLSALKVPKLFMLLGDLDPHIPSDDALGQLADLHRSGKVEHLGLSSVTANEISRAREHFHVVAVENELSVLNRQSGADGLVMLTEEQGIAFLARQPLGAPDYASRLIGDGILVPLAQRHNASPEQIALAALLNAGSHILPIVSATRVETLRSFLAATQITLDVSDRTALDFTMSFAPTPESLAAVRQLLPSRPITVIAKDAEKPKVRERKKRVRWSSLFDRPIGARKVPPCMSLAPGPEVVIVMGMQGAGKSFLASDYEDRGYLRLNQEGSRLVSRLEQVLEDRQKLVVLDGRFPTRRSRAPIIATARAHGIPTRCVYLRIAVTEAQVNIARRMLEQHGRLLEPEELKAGRKTSSPASLVRWLSTLEMPSTDEGFSSVEATPFVRRLDMAHRQRGLLLGVDGVLHTSKNGSIYPHDPDDVEILPGRFEALVRWIAHGYHLFFVSNQNPCSGGQAREMTDAILRRTAELLKLPVTEIVHCPHQAHPIVCWCCKPMPGLGVYLIDKHKLARRHLVVVGNMNSDVEFAAGLGARFIHAEHFFRMSSAVAGLSR